MIVQKNQLNLLKFIQHLVLQINTNKEYIRMKTKNPLIKKKKSDKSKAPMMNQFIKK